jgi:hypothetical protein
LYIGLAQCQFGLCAVSSYDPWTGQFLLNLQNVDINVFENHQFMKSFDIVVHFTNNKKYGKLVEKFISINLLVANIIISIFQLMMSFILAVV